MCIFRFVLFKTLQQARSGVRFPRPTQRKLLEFGLLATTGRSCLAQLSSSQCGFARWGGKVGGRGGAGGREGVCQLCRVLVNNFASIHGWCP